MVVLFKGMKMMRCEFEENEEKCAFCKSMVELIVEIRDSENAHTQKTDECTGLVASNGVPKRNEDTAYWFWNCVNTRAS